MLAHLVLQLVFFLHLSHWFVLQALFLWCFANQRESDKQTNTVSKHRTARGNDNFGVDPAAPFNICLEWIRFQVCTIPLLQPPTAPAHGGRKSSAALLCIAGKSDQEPGVLSPHLRSPALQGAPTRGTSSMATAYLLKPHTSIMLCVTTPFRQLTEQYIQRILTSRSLPLAVQAVPVRHVSCGLLVPPGC